MSTPAARRLSLFAVNCAYCTRHSTRIAAARRSNWQQTLHSTSRRWYADDTKPKRSSQASSRPARTRKPKKTQDDLTEATPEVVENKPQQVSETQVETTAEASKPLPFEDSTVSAANEEVTQAVQLSEDLVVGKALKIPSEPVSTEENDDVKGLASFPSPLDGDVHYNATKLSEDEGLQEDTTPSSDTASQVAPFSTTGHDTGLPAGAVLESEHEEEDPLEDILGTADAESQQGAIMVAMGSDTAGTPGAVEKAADDGGFWNYTAAGAGDAEYLKDNVTSLGHDELEQQREYREYARLAAWELPLLSKLAKPFAPPTKQRPLRFRYTSYLGEEHPAAAKVVLEFAPSDLPDLTEVQSNKLIKLLGVRYNPSTTTAKMSCEFHDTQAQNKRYLLDRLADLLKAARDPTDTFEDVPFDFRHHKPKVRHEFPKSWIVTEERLQQLVERRREQAQLEDKRKEIGSLVDGKKILQKVALEPPKEPQRVIVNRRTGERVMPRRRM